MYVCICNGIRESQIRGLARSVEGGPEQVYAALGRTPKCRQCLDTAGGILADERSSQLRAA
jgi:bacterioferritin-associated ferredoxin